MKSDIRVVFIGDSNRCAGSVDGIGKSGKTSLLSVIRDGTFPSECPPVVGEFSIPVDDVPSLSTIHLNDSSCKSSIRVDSM